MNSALLAVMRTFELPESELDGPVAVEEAVKIRHMVPAVIVVLGASVVCAVSFVPDVFEGFHGLWVSPVHQAQEIWVDRLAVVSGPALCDVDRLPNLLLMCCHDVDQVFHLVHREAVLARDVDVDPRPNLGVADRAGVPELPEKFL